MFHFGFQLDLELTKRRVSGIAVLDCQLDLQLTKIQVAGHICEGDFWVFWIDSSEAGRPMFNLSHTRTQGMKEGSSGSFLLALTLTAKPIPSLALPFLCWDSDIY